MLPHLPDPPLLPTPVPLPQPTDPLIIFYRQCSLTPLLDLKAKFELAFGLLLLIVGIFFLVRLQTQEFSLYIVVILFTSFGGYLALAGHRSLLYQSHIRLAANLAGLIRDYSPGPRS